MSRLKNVVIFLKIAIYFLLSRPFGSITGHDVVGCYKDERNRAIRELEGKDSILDRPYHNRENSIAKCAVAAMIAGYSMFAVQHGGQCFASATAPQTYDKYGESTACQADGEGGWWSNQVYAIKALGCQETLGMESGAITDRQVSGSLTWDSNISATRVRLHSTSADWFDFHNSWLQVDLNSVHRVKRVATQGAGISHWVTKYKLQYRNDTESFQYYKEPGQNTDKIFDGNTDQSTVVYHDLNPPITARYIRFQPVDSHDHVSMRVELYGCLQGGGGGGFYSSGRNGTKNDKGGEGGKGFLQGGVGGKSQNGHANGGFGGGGGGAKGGGGGGGYSGGSGGNNEDDSYGGGGGSYNVGKDQQSDCCYNTAGHVIITLL